MSLLSIVAGGAAGFLGGLLGIGGGSILVPLMVGYLGFSQHLAHGTSLAVVVLIAAVGTVSYYLQGYVDGTLVAGLLAGSIAGAILGALAMNRLPERRLRQVFGAFLAFAALRLFWP